MNADGSINLANRLSENEWYRSYLGFRAGVLKPGDIVEVWGKGSFYGGDPEFVDQEGVQADGVEFKIVGHDDSLAKPTYFSSIGGFWNETYKNHYVKFIAKKSGASTVTDSSGTTITIQDVTGYATKTLPGNVGQLLVITGVPTSESYALRFRADSAAVATPQSYPPDSHVNPVTLNQASGPLALTATADVAPGSNSNFYSLEPVADAQVESGVPGSNFNTTNLYIQSAASGSYGNERSWLRFDLSSIPAGSMITSAKLSLSCWKATGANLPAEIRGGDSDTWGETAVTWNTQPTFGTALDTQTLLSGVTNTVYSWDATSFAQTKFAGNKLVSLLVKPVTENSTDATSPSYGFDSREYTANHPYLQVTTPASGTPVTLAQVQFFSRYSADGTTWTAWAPFQTATSAPWNATFTYTNGAGHYQFYSIATDSAGSVEPEPPYADTEVNYSPGAAIAVEQPAGTSLVAGTSSIGLAGTDVGSSSAPKTFTIRNTGVLPLLLSAPTLTGGNTADFAVDASGMSLNLPTGEVTTFNVNFSPTVGGSRSTTLRIASNDANQNPFDITLTGQGSATDITVEQPAGTGIVSGGTKNFGTTVLGTPVSLVFTINNPGAGNLTGLGITKDGANADDFMVTASPTAPVPAGGSTPFTVQFAPATGATGMRTASIHIASNVDAKNPYNITLTGQALSFATDTDGDGLNDASEYLMGALGFNWQVAQPTLVNALFSNVGGAKSNLNVAGYYSADQVQTLNVGTPLISKNPANGLMKLTIGVTKSPDLVAPFAPFPMTAPQTTINAQGKLEFEFAPPGNSAFFRLESK